MVKTFEKPELDKLYRPVLDSGGEGNGQVTIIGGSKLFHGAPLLSTKVASRIVDMVFFASPEPNIGRVAEQFKSKLFSFIWIPWEEVEAYIEKSDAVLIGPGFMRFGSEKTPEEKRDYSHHRVGKISRKITKELLAKFPDKRWVIDAGSLQVMDPDWIPKGTILTPNKKEYELLFKDIEPGDVAKKYNCVINVKGTKNIVCSPEECCKISGGNTGLTKGGVGDVLAGMTVALYAKNESFLAATAASYITKSAADELHKKVGPNYNADDLADKIPETFYKLTGSNTLP